MFETSFKALVLHLVAAIPQGKVATYGQIAALAGSPRAARQVGGILRYAQDSALPWQRVINASGRLSTYKIGAGELQKALLQAEGVVFEDGCIDLATYRWQPDSV